jgi:hypothetical protein
MNDWLMSLIGKWFLVTCASRISYVDAKLE